MHFNEKVQYMEKASGTFMADWCETTEALVALVPDKQEEAAQMRAVLEKGRVDMLQAMHHPVLRISTAGTTSSGKSSLLNFLCGTELLPTAVQEMSAGIVRVVHADTPQLTIEETRHATWECGVWEDIDAKAIYTRLEDAMERYRAGINEEGADIEPPVAVIQYPIWLNKRIGLGANVSVELIDLPGLKFCNDTKNIAVMKRCPASLSIIVYNSFETDCNKQEELLEQVVAQVGRIGGSISRMLFVATRVDTFLKDDKRHWPTNLHKFLQSRTVQIAERLRKEFPETFSEQQASEMQMARLSPTPALFAYQLRDERVRLQAWMRISDGYGALVSSGYQGNVKEGLNTLTDLSSASPHDWNDQDWDRLFVQLADTTGGEAFLQRLSQHIESHVDDIVLLPAREVFYQSMGEVLTWLLQTCDATLIAVKDKYEERKAFTDVMKKQLAQINATARQVLDPFLMEMENTLKDFANIDTANARLSDTLRELAQDLHIENEQLTPLRSWETNMGAACKRPLRAVCERLIDNISISEDIPFALALNQRCHALSSKGYRGIDARDGMKDVTTDENKIQYFSTIRQHTGELYKDAERSVAHSMTHMFDREKERIYTAIDLIKEHYLLRLQQMYVVLPEEIRNIGEMAPLTLKKSTHSLTMKTLDIDNITHLQSESYTKKARIPNKSTHSSTPIRWVVDSWRKLTGNDTLEIEVPETKLTAHIPSIRTLLENGYRDCFTVRRREIVDVFYRLILEQLTLFKEQIDDYQQDLFASYESRLEHAAQSQLEHLRHEESTLEEISAKVKALHEAYIALQGEGHG